MQSRFKVPISLVEKDTGSADGPLHSRRGRDRVGPFSSDAALAPHVNQPWGDVDDQELLNHHRPPFASSGDAFQI